MTTSMEIILKRSSKIYHPGETLYGCVVTSCKAASKHEGVSLVLEGLLSVQASPKTVGIIDSLVNSAKPLLLHSTTVEVCGAGRLSAGTTEHPFEVTLPLSTPDKPLHETFHGNCINVHYLLRCTMKRGVLAKPLMQMTEFIVEHKAGPIPPAEPLRFSLSPASAATAGERARLPAFLVRGHLHNSRHPIAAPLTGEVVIEECSGGTGAVSSVELQLQRLETCGPPGDPTTRREVSSVQGWQVCCGDVARGLAVPLCLPLPRVFTCASTDNKHFALGFQLSVIVVFGNDHLVTENFPLELVR